MDAWYMISVHACNIMGNLLTFSGLSSILYKSVLVYVPLIHLFGSWPFSDIVVLYGCSSPPSHVAFYKLITEAVLILHKDKIFGVTIHFRCRISSLQVRPKAWFYSTMVVRVLYWSFCYQLLTTQPDMDITYDVRGYYGKVLHWLLTNYNACFI